MINYRYFTMLWHTSLTLITVPCGCSHFRFFYCSACWALSEVTRLVLCKTFAQWIKLPSADVDKVQLLFLSIFPICLQKYLHHPHDPLKHCIFYIDPHAVNVLVSHGENFIIAILPRQNMFLG